MCDSDDDEFLSASEGEYDDVDEKCRRPSTVSPKDIEEKEEDVGSSGKLAEEKPEEQPPVKENVVKAYVEESPKQLEIVDTGSSQESLLEENNFLTSGSSGSESQSDSLSSEKQRLLEEVVKETLAQDVKEVTSKQPGSITDSEKSLDEGGWDDFDIENNTAMVTPTKDTPVKEISDKKPVELKKEAPAVVKKIENSLDEGDWDDWGDETTQKKSDEFGCTDWSLIDEKKVKEATLKKETDPWVQEQTTRKTEKKTSGWGWGGLVSAVGETFTSTIESSLGLPSAEEVARRQAQQQKELAERVGDVHLEEETDQKEPLVSNPLGFGMLSGLVSGGIDVLETIGKKTFEAVTVKDEKAGRRRMIFTESGQNLSDVLKELKERQEREIPFQMGSVTATKQLPDVASQFGRSEGIAHLEALEMLSNNRPKALPKFEREFFGALSEVDTERVEDGDFSRLLSDILNRINLPYEPKTLLDCDNEIATRLAWSDGKSAEGLFSDSVQCLVEFTASSVQVVSKLANLLLILHQDVNFHDFVSLFALLSQRANFIANQYTEALSVSTETTKADELVTQTHVECSTAIDFIRQAHRLLAPMFHNL